MIISDKTPENVKTQVSCDVVVTSSIIYLRAHSILSQGMGDDSARVLYFLRHLLRVTLLEASSDAASRARELLRISGCLQDITRMFLGTMTKCIQRCNVSNSEVMKVLHSLLRHNARTIQIFVDSNGLSIFTREKFQDTPTMKLLATVVQHSAAAKLLQHNTELMRFLFKCHDYSDGHALEKIEWASIILFNICSAVEGVEMTGESTERDLTSVETDVTESTRTSSIGTSLSFLRESNWDNFKNNLDNPVGDIRITDSSDEQMRSLPSSIDLLTENDFSPNYVSLPKITHKTTRESKDSEFRSVHKSIELHKRLNVHKRQPRVNNSAPVIKQTLSMSAALFNVVNNSFATIYDTIGNMFNNPVRARPQKDIPNRNFTIDNSISGQKLRRTQKFRDIVRKLKNGMYIYGCNFKKISQAMWPKEKKITPQVLFCIYRKYIIKRKRDLPTLKKQNKTLLCEPKLDFEI